MFEQLNCARRRRRLATSALVIGVGSAALIIEGAAQLPPWSSGIEWPKPEVVDPGPPGGVPSDAIVLFDGKDMSHWDGADKWTIQDGYTAAASNIATTRPFGDCQLHVEWAAPPEVKSSGQRRGNSGIHLMGRYEIQVLDSYENDTYVDGEAAAVYKQRPPLVNACRKPGEWQTYEIVFRGPRFDEQGKLLRPAFVTVLHNGVLVQDHFQLLGPTDYRIPPKYTPHEPKLPLKLQYHGSPVRYRKIWIRELGDDREDLLAPLRKKQLAGEPIP